MERPVGSLTVGTSGFAQYQYPIAVPPGTGQGNEPSLSLSFFHGMNANGILGPKWSLNGLSSIILIQPTLAVDGKSFTSNAPATCAYRYALDGVELLCISGTYGEAGSTYKQESDLGIGQIVTLSSNGSFAITDQFGGREEYGTTPDSCITTTKGGASVIIEWKLKRSYDFRGNYVEYNYISSPGHAPTLQDTGILYISSIRYTSNDKAQQAGKMQVNFLYKPRLDPVQVAVWGRLTCTAHLLSQITTTVETANASIIPARTYNLEYTSSPSTGDSLLTSVTEAGSEAGSLAPTVFKYSGAKPVGDTWNIFSQSRNNIAILPKVTNPLTILPLNMTGRSYADLACIENDTGTMTVRPFLATPSFDQSGKDTTIQWTPRPPVQIAQADSLAETSLLVADIDCDGRTDIVVAFKNKGNLSFSVANATGSGFDQTATIHTQQEWTDGCKFFAIDVNGNGMVDVVQISAPRPGAYQISTYYDIYSATANQPPTKKQSEIWSDSSATIEWLPVQLQTTTGTSLIRITDEEDPTSVGKSIITATLFSAAGSQPFSKNPYLKTAKFPLITHLTKQRPLFSVLAADLNGDGVEDIVVCEYSISGEAGKWTLSITFTTFLFDGAGGFTAQTPTNFSLVCSTQTLKPQYGTFYVMNLDGSRYPSIMYAYEDTNRDLSGVFGMGSSTGQINAVYKTLIASSANSPTTSSQPWQLSPTDLNGIGRGGFAMRSISDTGICRVCPVYNVITPSDYLISTTNPLGLHQEITYAPMSLPSLYDPAVDWNGYRPPHDTSPVPVFGSSTHLVSQVTTRNDASINALPIGGLAGRVMSYTYKGGLLSRDGRGWLGHASFIELDAESGVQSISKFDQVWPTAGKLLRKDIYGSSHAELISRLTSWPPDFGGTDASKLICMQSTISTYTPGALLTNPNNAPIYLSTLTSTETITFDQGPQAPVAKRTIGAEYTYFDNTSNRKVEHTYEKDENGMILTELYKKISLAPTTNGISILPFARKVTTVKGASDFSKFESGDLSFKQFHYDSQGNLSISKVWSSDLSSFCSTDHLFDTMGNEVSVTNPSGMTTVTDFDSVYRCFPVKTTSTGLKAIHTTYSAYDPRYGTSFATCSAYGDISAAVRDQWGRRTQKWEVDTNQSDPPTSKFSQPSCLVLDPELQQKISSLRFCMSEKLSYDSISSAAGSNYLCRSKTLYNDQSTPVTSPSQQFLDAENHVRKFRSQDDNLSPVAWQYREFDSRGIMILDSFPQVVIQGADWVPNYQSCKIVICDALQRPALSIAPPTFVGDKFTSLESIYGIGGALKTTNLRQSESLLYGSTDNVVESLQHTFSSFDNKMYVTREVNNSGAAKDLYYDPTGNIQKVIADSNGPKPSTETREYNSLGLVSTINNKYQNPTGTAAYGVSKVYNSLGKLHVETNAMRQSTEFRYDNKGRLTTRSDWDNRITQYTYDDPSVGIDKLAAVSISLNDANELSYAYTYDPRGLLKTETLTLFNDAVGGYVTSYTYDLQGKLTDKVLPDMSKLSYVWKGESLFSVSMTSPEGETWDVTTTYQNYNAAEEPQNWTLKASQSITANLSGSISYDGQGRPLEMTFDDGSGKALVDLHLAYDALGQIFSSKDTVTNTSTSYTYVDRRLKTSTSGSTISTYDYDGSGVINNKNGMALTYSTSNTGAEVQGFRGGSQIYSCAYDAAGRAISRQTPNNNIVSMTYDGYGKMRTMVLNNSNTTTFVSDHQEQTVVKKDSFGNIEVHCGKEYDVVVRSDTKKQIRRRRMFDADGRILATVTSTYASGSNVPLVELDAYMKDHKGTVTHAFNGTGNIERVFNYDDFGALQTITTNGAPIVMTEDDLQVTYEAKTQDVSTNLLDFGGRWYDPFIGRFTTPDMNLSVKYLLRPDGTNLYAFECNDPINNVDPTGHINWNFVGGIAVGVLLVGGAIALTIATGGLAAGGLAAVAAAAGTGALSGAGLAALGYSWANRNTTDAAKFWKGFGVTVAIGAVTGAITGAGGEFLQSAACLDNLMSISSDSLTVAKGAAADGEQSMARYLFGVGSKALLDGGSSIGEKVADTEAQNATMGTHQTFTWKGLLESGAESAGLSAGGSLLKGGYNNSETAQGAVTTLKREAEYTWLAIKNPSWSSAELRAEMIWRK